MTAEARWGAGVIPSYDAIAEEYAQHAMVTRPPDEFEYQSRRMYTLATRG